MKLLIYIILGIIQGFTEPLPVSSSGHIFLFKNIFNTNIFNDLNFEIVANFGSFLAILFIFRKDIIELVTSFFKYIFKKKERKKYKDKFKYCIALIISTIPVGIVGILLKDFIENKLQNIYFLGFAFLITALMLFLIRNKNGKKEDKDITYKDAIIIGLIQMITVMPGISRSGTVLVACLLCGLSRSSALKYTFILYFPISAATMILGVSDIIEAGNLNELLIPYLSGLVAAGIVTYFTYKWLSDMVKKGKLWKFSIYCICLAIFIFIYFR
ncbi:MAG: undecaprenyl-diphosphate phosphatase [Firmicutes bacterium]|nr:undecaprenyl-diphosphate phosphatase [Bacillota bacterium]